MSDPAVAVDGAAAAYNGAPVLTDVSFSAAVNPAGATATISVSPASLNLGTTYQGTPGAARLYTVAGSNLTAPIVITPGSPGVEISSDVR